MGEGSWRGTGRVRLVPGNYGPFFLASLSIEARKGTLVQKNMKVTGGANGVHDNVILGRK
jgi:hypothetical protein